MMCCSAEDRHVPTRSFFGEDFCYIMDAKSVGNLGRYMNVSDFSSNTSVLNVLSNCSDSE
jgi:histone-lysine N-methyltransferase SETDB1